MTLTQYGENHTGGEDGSKEICDGDDQGFFGKVVSDRVIGGQCNQATKSQAKGVKNLCGGIQPYLGLKQLAPLKIKIRRIPHYTRNNGQGLTQYSRYSFPILILHL